MNAVAKTVQAKVNTRRLLANSKFAFTNIRTLITELLQNARRAGATQVAIELSGDILTVTDDGAGVRDMQDLLHIAESGWDTETQETESPYGLGFLACLHAATRVRVESGGWCLDALTQDILALTPVELIPLAFHQPGTRVTLTGCEINGISGAMACVPSKLEDLVRGFPIPVTFNGVGVEREHALDGSFADFGAGKIHIAWDRVSPHHGFAAILYLQGIHVEQHQGKFSPIVVHLDPAQFKGRMPDRDVLVSPNDDHLSVIRTAVLAYIRTCLEEKKARLGDAAFVAEWGDVCLDEDVLRPLLEAADCVPRNWFRNPIAEVVRPGGVVSRAQIEASTVFARDSDMHEDGAMAERFAGEAGIPIIEPHILTRLRDGYWLKRYVRHVHSSEFSVEIHGEIGRTTFLLGSDLVTVVACEGYTITHPDLESVRITGDRVGLFTGMRGTKDGRLLVMSSLDTNVLNQVEVFEFDGQLDEESLQESEDCLRVTHLGLCNADPAIILKAFLESKNAEWADGNAALMGKTFAITFDDVGRLTEVKTL